MYISSFYRRGIDAETKDLCCEEVTLVAGGSFVGELPSAPLPLLIPDLPVFLWWHDIFKLNDSLFEALCRGANRLIVDSVAFLPEGLSAISQLCDSRDHMRVGISDINWARLTFWRGLLASFYDVPQHLIALEALSAIEVDYSAPESSAQMIAPQAMLIPGCLASRLGWHPVLESRGITEEGLQIDLNKRTAQMRLKLNKVERVDLKPRRLARVELRSDGESTAFLIKRNQH